MEFGAEKCAMFLMKSGKRETTEGIDKKVWERLEIRKTTSTWKYSKSTPSSKQKKKEKKKREPLKKEKTSGKLVLL